MAKEETKLPVRATFSELARREDDWLSKRPGSASAARLEQTVSEPTDADEPWITFTNRDRFGIALSGGGIRSATFNLGVLQALGAKGILDHVDYLSTVSGGGYVGGFWTSLRHHLGGATPQPLAERATSPAESAAVRHLREFSRFLVPRIGFAHAETWAAIVAVIGGMLPTLIAAGALIAAIMYAWIALCWTLFQAGVAYGAIALGAITLVIQLGAEVIWHAHKKGGDSAHWLNGVLVAILAALLGATTWYAARASGWSEEWCATPGHWGRSETAFCSYLFYPAAAWCVVAVSLLVLTALLSRWRKASSPLDRAAGRFFATALLWAILAGVWECSRLLVSSTFGYGVTVGSAVTAGGLFVWLRKWLGGTPEETRGAALFRRAIGYLKPITPQLLALIAVLALFVAFTALLQRFGRPELYGFLAIATVAGLGAVLFDPAKLGLHDFYRGRIARCYLGAAKAYLRSNRPSVEQPDDEIAIQDLVAAKQGPIHLVCCAANNLSGDPLVGLYRGARSAVISPFGISVGGFSSSVDGLGLSAALTASAAAFNSQMGAVSMRLGPSVAFLMTALNLRLGLWVPHPLSPPQEYRFPGRFLLFEALGLTSCHPVEPKLAEALGKVGADPDKLAEPELKKAARRRALHLSDGGHFENLGLYELVRRHCRYLVVSDATADSEVAFDDLANAVRRVREDFGVEIELDVSPLRPDAERVSKQHAVIGTVHYDGLGGSDKGVLLYLKPTLVGDEPTDVTQYRARNRAFPHEGTEDQFYDEAQWESYRRLGEHVAGVTFAFVDHGWPSEANFVERLFQAASQRWHRAQREQSEIFLALTERCSEIETDIRDNAPASLRDEFFPEVQEIVGARSAPAARKAEDEVRTLYFLMQVAQVMEDVWLAAELDRFWSHPLNEGWMSYFHRWTSTPSFRRWWPVLRPIYGVGFRDFVKERFGLRVKDDFARSEPEGPGARLELAPVVPAQLKGLATEHYRRRHGPLPQAERAFEYRLSVSSEPPVKPVQVGFLTFNEANGSVKTAVWRSSDLFVSPPLIGGGIISRFLDAIVKSLKADGYAAARVILDDGEGGQRRDPASRQERVSTINFYKSRGFVYTAQNPGVRTLELRFD